MSTNGHKAPPVRKLPQHGASRFLRSAMIILSSSSPPPVIVFSAARLTPRYHTGVARAHDFPSSILSFRRPADRVHDTGVKGAYYAGHWVDLEDCAGTYQPNPSECSGCAKRSTCPRSRSRNAPLGGGTDDDVVYDVVVVGAGCIGGAIVRELSRYDLRVLLLESADDVSQGATKGNSGIVHAGYDDAPGSLHAKFCWPGNQMFPQLDRELRFGYQLNGSLVIATDEKELKVLDELMERGRKNGVERLRIVGREELFEMEPALNPKAIAALHSPDAGNVIPYEFAIALVENAVDNGVELRIRREVTDIKRDGGSFVVTARHWEPGNYVEARKRMGKSREVHSSDKIARMIGDDSFYIKPRLGDYLLLNRNQGHLASRTIFPCPDPVLGKGVLVQTTLWGNLILGPTARDVHLEEARGMSRESIQEYILSKCKQLCPYFDPKETIHAFCGARAKSSRGDWIIEPSARDGHFIHVAGIDSPGLAGSPAIALEVVRLLRAAGLETPPNVSFNPNRAPIITPKAGMKGLKMGPVGKNDSNGTDAEEAVMASNVICKCEKVTELEVVRAMRRSLPIDSSQAIRKRTRAGMGHCQGDKENYNCECRVRAIIARENGVSVEEVGGRPWPATSTLSQRWIDDDEKRDLEARMAAAQ
ncbi:hypothetical protein ACHAW5_005333 [Stephanodiscus triporus]|uniref:FAD dependent oxidoreductase domain-containing protein n=1 Tax=Stephanodiscus triporus TaxID=2934178 RepID=A0ABD3NJZ6_9STRA